jgi:hypothetical protein
MWRSGIEPGYLRADKSPRQLNSRRLEVATTDFLLLVCLCLLLGMHVCIFLIACGNTYEYLKQRSVGMRHSRHRERVQLCSSTRRYSRKGNEMPWGSEHHPGLTHDRNPANNKAGDHEGTLQAVSAQARGRCRCSPLLSIQGTRIWAPRGGGPVGAPGRAGGGRRRQDAGRSAPVVRARRAGHQGSDFRPMACRRGPAAASGGGGARRWGECTSRAGGAWGGQDNVGDACTPAAEVPGSTCSTQISGITLQDRSGNVRLQCGKIAYPLMVFVI